MPSADRSAPSEITRALHARVDATNARPTVTPLYQTSAFQQGSDFFYSRANNPNTAELEEVVRTLAGAGHAIATCTGMAAIAVVVGLLAPGELLVVNRLTYGCSYRFFQRLAERGRFRTVTLDLTTEEGLAAIPEEARMVFFETPTNPFLRTVPIRAVADRVGPDTLVVVDNTWATPLHQRPLEHGAHLSLHSATKYFGGHSDVMGGVILTDDEALAATVREERFYSGVTLDPHSSWLVRRSLQTLPVRMEHHVRSTRLLTDFLRDRPEIGTVYEPEVDGEQLLAYGGIVFVELAPGLEDRYEALAEALELFTTGTGMAAVSAMVAQPCSGSHASLTEDELREMEIGPGLVRLCFGLEDPDDLIADLGQALDTIAS